MNDSIFKYLKPFSSLLGIIIILILTFTFGARDTQTLTQLFEETFDETLSELAPSPAASPRPTPVLGTQATESGTLALYPVTKITDGDTIKVSIDGTVETVRLVGINTPETVDPRRDVECFGAQASQRMKTLLEGQLVSLESDATQSNRDRYQRLLRFVFLQDGTDVGLQMIKEGYAHEALYSSKPHKYYQEYVAAQLTAEAAAVGLWQPGVCTR